MKNAAGLIYSRFLIKLIFRIHSKGKHQQGIAVALVSKELMWIIWNHCSQRYKNPELLQGSDYIFAK